MSSTQAIAYRRMVASLARELSAAEVKDIAYIRLTGDGNVSKYVSNPPTASGLDLLATLERLGVFSQKNTKGLVDIAKDVNRQDLVKKVENYRKNPPSAVRYSKKKQRGSQSEQRRQLEETFELMVTQLAVLEQHASLLRRALNEGKDEEPDEALEVLRLTGEAAQDMGSKLSDVHQKLSRRSPDPSTVSDSDSCPSSGEDTARPQDVAVDRVSTVSGEERHSRTKPIPKQRKHPSIQESAMPPLQLLIPPPLECQDWEPTGYMHLVTSEKPQICPRKIPLQSATGSSDVTEIVNQLPDGDTDEMKDNTGDSGMGTGSETVKVEIWRQAISNPPPHSIKHQLSDLPKHTYQPISSDNREPDTIYDTKQE